MFKHQRIATVEPNPRRSWNGLSVGGRIGVLSVVPLLSLAIVFVLYMTGEQRVNDQLALSRSHVKIAFDIKAFRDEIVAPQLSLERFLGHPGLVARAGDALDTIVAQVSELNETIVAIAASALEQAQGSNRSIRPSLPR